MSGDNAMTAEKSSREKQERQNQIKIFYSNRIK